MLEPWQANLVEDDLQLLCPMNPEMLLSAMDWRGITVGDMSPFTNERVAIHYGTCSIQHHHLQILQRYRIRPGRLSVMQRYYQMEHMVVKNDCDHEITG